MKYDLNKLIIIGKPRLGDGYAKAVGRATSRNEDPCFHIAMMSNRRRFDSDKKSLKYLSDYHKGSKEFLACSYIVGKGVPQDFNKAFEVYPVRENPICSYSAWLNGKMISVEELLFGKEEK